MSALYHLQNVNLSFDAHLLSRHPSVGIVHKTEGSKESLTLKNDAKSTVFGRMALKEWDFSPALPFQKVPKECVFNEYN